MPSAIIIGSGPAGSIAAHELAANGWDVTVLERGRNLRPGFGEVPSGELKTLYSSDEIKSARHFGFPHPNLEPLTGRTRGEAAGGTDRSIQGRHVSLGAAVGGTSLHYNAKFPRFWKQDFTMLSDSGPIDGAQVADWPISYDELEPFYDEVEHKIGVQGDTSQMPQFVLDQTPRSRNYPMAPNPTGYAARLIAAGAETLGYSPYPYPSAVNSREFDGRPACNSCGLCSSFGCPINARGDALTSYLNPAVLTGRVTVIERAHVFKIATNDSGTQATAVHYYDIDHNEQVISADKILLAASPIQTARLLLLSKTENGNGVHATGLGNRSDQVGRNMMFHYFIIGGAEFDYDVQTLRAQSTTVEIDDFVGPFDQTDYAVAATRNIPYFKGGLIQVGSGLPLLTEAYFYGGLGFTHGAQHKTAMTTSLGRQKIAGIQFVGEDLPQADNRVDLDPEVTDWHDLPVPRVTYSPHEHEKVAAEYFTVLLETMCLAAPGARTAVMVPHPTTSEHAANTAHHAGTARMGDDPNTSVCDKFGALHDCSNVYVVDGSTFPTFPGFNPTLTVMANSLRIARTLVQNEAQA